MDSIKINVDYLKTVNYALFHNKIPVCQSIELTNISDSAVEDVKVICEGEFISRYESELISRINPGESLRISSYKVTPDSSKLAVITERIVTGFKLSVTSAGEEITSESFDIEFMPYDHWTGTTILPQTIVSFITPNHPAISNVVVRSAEMLKMLTGSSALNEYQTGNINDVRQQVAAVFAAVHDLGIVYRGIPAGYEEIGQRITLPYQVVTSKIANCIELTLLMASVLEAIGINCVIIFQQGHAFFGVWLVDDCYSCSVCDDPAFIEKKCSRGIDEMLVIECTHLSNEKASFEEAVRAAEMRLARHNLFEMFIDVKRSRLERIFPLPMRIDENGVGAFDTSGVEHDACLIEVREHDRFDLSRISGNDKELTKFDIWERKLLDFSLRNSLLNLSVRRRAVQFISFDINRIEDHLQDGKEYCITSKPNVEFVIDTEENFVRSKLYEPLHELVSNDIEHRLLHTFLPENETKSVLKNIYRAARNAIEETGANSLFLSIGALRWFETDRSSVPRYAPLLLLPVEMVYKKGNYYIRTRDEEISLNITLLEFLRQNYDITIEGLNPLPLDGSGVDVPLIFAIVRDALKTQKRWDVEEECVLGTFSFSKFLMWNDIHSHREELRQSEIINSLVANRLTWTPTPVASDLKDIDMNVSPIDTALPVPVDSSQMAAVIEGGNGNSFILYGPPGTGKSQTITNLIANALYHGKRVLFVAEKMAALSVVQSRLEKIGLDPFCLELHSNKTTKRHVLQQLEKALKVVHIVPPEDYSATAEKIFARRKELIEYMVALHERDHADNLSLYDCIISYESIAAEPLAGFKYAAAIDELLAREGIKGIEQLLGSHFETVLKLVGQPSGHPLNGLTVDRDMLADSEGAGARMKSDSATIAGSLRRYSELSDAKAQRKRMLCCYAPAIFDEDPEELYQQWRAVKSKWFLFRYFAQRKFINRLKQYDKYLLPQEVDTLIERLITYRKRHEEINGIQQILKQYFNLEYDEDELPEVAFLERTVQNLERWSENTELMRDWIHWCEYCAELKANGLGCVVEALQAQELEIATIKDSYLKALFKHKCDKKIAGSKALAAFEGMLFDEKTAAYKKLTEEYQILTRKELYARLAARVPRMTDGAVTGSEIGLLNRNISNGGRGQSLRDLFDQLPTLMPRLCPCMLMSPMSVAQYIDLSAEKFDLVVFDEASQMPTSEAVGAIARGKSLIVVGDPKQMPPTSFFTSTNVDVEEVAIDDMESILEDCRTLDMPSLQLSWHYRSRHESLIAFSNNEYYEGSLITFPSVDDKTTKVHFVPVAGFYDKGGKRSNKAEAEAIVDEIVRRIKDENLRRHSIGVIAFNVMQQGLIEDLLQERLDRDKSLHDAAAQLHEPIFVKNLENVQGDERDIILFSIGYGPDKNGKVSMNFGPLNNAGGERRLNVAVSRARHEMYIFSTLKSSDIDLRRSKARGVEGLKHFLHYAETQSLPSVAQAGSSFRHSVIADRIASELRGRGYVVATDVGRSQFRVDVAVAEEGNPDRYMLGILLDGENYRDTATTRDREIVQPSVLGGLDWKVMRVWSVDWFNNKNRIIERIIEKLGEKPDDEPAPKAEPEFDISTEKIAARKTNAIEYVRYTVHPDKANGMADLDLMGRIINAEYPITFRYLCRRMIALRGGVRLSHTMLNEFREIADRFHNEDGAIWKYGTSPGKYKYFRPDSGRDIAEIPGIELVNVLKETLAEHLILSEDNLILGAIKKMGFSRRSAAIDTAFRAALEKLKASGTLEIAGDSLRLKS